tara:strand:+ start:1044 stop:1244 length:201 start_codon:yes stop_codon:yes gene_type:complete
VSVLAAIKLLKTAKQVHDYVKKPNNLDMQNEMIITRIKKLENKVEKLSKILKKNKKVVSEYKWYDE